MKWLQSSKISLVLIGVLSFAVAAPATEDTWTYKADMPTTRTYLSGCVLDGKIYIVGGARSDYSATSVVEMYDPLLDTWTKMADMPSSPMMLGTVWDSSGMARIGFSTLTTWRSPRTRRQCRRERTRVYMSAPAVRSPPARSGPA